MAEREITRTALTRTELERNEAFVVAEGSLRRERVVSVVRILVIAFTAVTQTVMNIARDAPFDPWRFTVGLSYLGFSIGVYRGVGAALKEARSDNWLRATKIWPIIVTLVDVLAYTLLFLLPVHRPEWLSALHHERAAFAFALLIVFSLARASVWHVWLSTGMSLLAYWFTVYAPYHLYGTGPRALSQGGTDLELYISSVFLFVGYVGLGYLVSRVQGVMREDFKGLRSIDNLKKFLPSAVAERIARGGQTALKPVQRNVTVMFTDIRDFTTHCESLEPKQVLELLDEYLAHMAQVVKGHDGIVNKFLGDGMLAFWGVPELNDRHAEQAVSAALDIRKKIEELNAHRRTQGLKELRIGVGVHTGVVAAGMLGGADQHEYTVIGDAVNVASRIEGLNKAHGTDILVSEATIALIEGRFVAERVGEERVKGRERPVVVYKLVDRAAVQTTQAA